jgi:hypothetical protein
MTSLADSQQNSHYKYLLLCIQCILLDFKLSPCCSNDELSSGYFPGVWVLKADVSELCVGSIFTCWRWNQHRVPKRRLLILRCRGNTQKTIHQFVVDFVLQQSVSCECIELMVGDWWMMNWKGCGRMQYDSISTQTQHFYGGPEENNEKVLSFANQLHTYSVSITLLCSVLLL